MDNSSIENLKLALQNQPQQVCSILEDILNPILQDEHQMNLDLHYIQDLHSNILSLTETTIQPQILFHLVESYAKISVILFTRITPNQKSILTLKLFHKLSEKINYAFNTITKLSGKSDSDHQDLGSWIKYISNLLQTITAVVNALLLVEHEDFIPKSIWIPQKDAKTDTLSNGISVGDTVAKTLVKIAVVSSKILKNLKSWNINSGQHLKNDFDELSNDTQQYITTLVTLFIDNRHNCEDIESKAIEYSNFTSALVEITASPSIGMSLKTSLSKTLISLCENSKIRNFPSQATLVEILKIEVNKLMLYITSINKLVAQISSIKPTPAIEKQNKTYSNLIRFELMQSTKIIRFISKYGYNIGDEVFKSFIFPVITALIQLKESSKNIQDISACLKYDILSSMDVVLDAFITNILLPLGYEIITQIITSTTESKNNIVNSLKSNKNNNRSIIKNWVDNLYPVQKLSILKAYCIHFNILEHTQKTDLLNTKLSENGPAFRFPLFYCMSLLTENSILSNIPSSNSLSPKEFGKTEASSDYEHLVLSISMVALSLESICFPDENFHKKDQDVNSKNSNFGETINEKCLKLFALWEQNILSSILLSAPENSGTICLIDAWTVVSKHLSSSLVYSQITSILNITPTLSFPSLVSSRYYVLLLIKRLSLNLTSTECLNLSKNILEKLTDPKKPLKQVELDDEDKKNSFPEILSKISLLPWELIYSRIRQNQNLDQSVIFKILNLGLKTFATLISPVKVANQKNDAISTPNINQLCDINISTQAMLSLFTADIPHNLLEKSAGFYTSMFLALLSNENWINSIVEFSIFPTLLAIITRLLPYSNREHVSKILDLIYINIKKSKNKSLWASTSLSRFCGRYISSPHYSSANNNIFGELFMFLFKDSRWYIVQSAIDILIELIINEFDAAVISGWVLPSMEKTISACIGDGEPVPLTTKLLNQRKLLERIEKENSSGKHTSLKDIKERKSSNQNLGNGTSLDKFEIINKTSETLLSHLKDINEFSTLKTRKELNQNLYDLYHLLSDIYN
ncbi:hypothetical protein BB559_006921 [Furculomyces boomerangus]|uniref:Uncharacterized protein n=1 Tax=Furculomyces boomerangus TaxID=61424 RepID=A0A2T9XZQ9_9FUNG|nr:hypothetical protein BB559_006921 [Furculomyces boomerangus]